MKRLRVAISTHLFPSEVTGLSGPWLAEQADALAEFCDVHVLAALRECRARDEVRPSGVRVAYRPTRVLPGSGRLALLTSAARYRAMAVRHMRSLHPRPDVLHAHFGFPDAVVISGVARRMGLPWVATLHGDDGFFLLGRPDALGRMMRRALAGASAIICVSPAMAEAVAGVMGDGVPILTIENGHDDVMFSLEPGEHSAGILYVGLLIPRKNVDILMHAYAGLPSAPSLQIVGDGPLAASLQALASHLGIDDKVQFLGEQPRDRVAGFMQNARMLVVPSASEAWGMVAAEALSCGTPVVASAVGGLPRIVASPEAGILVQPGSVDELASALRDALARTWDPQQVAAASGSRPWREKAAEIAEVYERVVTAQG